MGNRIKLSKRQRFDVFKRDLFVCQYCGQKPPAVVLEVDHIVPVADGGGNDAHNLITACFDCNRGKADGSLQASPIDIGERSEMLSARLEQTRAYEELLAEQRQLQDQAIDDVISIYEFAFEGWTLKDRIRPSIRQFLNLLPKSEVIDAMELACSRMSADSAFKYFCGICWRKVKGD